VRLTDSVLFHSSSVRSRTGVYLMVAAFVYENVEPSESFSAKATTRLAESSVATSPTNGRMRSLRSRVLSLLD